MRGSRHSLSRPTSCKSTGTSGHSGHDVHRSMVSDSNNNIIISIIINIIVVITIIIIIAYRNLLFAHLSGVYLTTGSLWEGTHS